MRWLVVFLVLTLTSCHGQKQLSKGADHAAAKYQLKLVLEDLYFPVDSVRTDIIKDTKSLKAFFSEVNKTRKPGLPLPNIDFTQEIVLLICLGATKAEQIPNIYMIEGKDNQLIVNVGIMENKAPEAGVTYPFYLYKMLKVDKHIRFTIDLGTSD